MAVADTNRKTANRKHDTSRDETAIVVECDDGPQVLSEAVYTAGGNDVSDSAETGASCVQ